MMLRIHKTEKKREKLKLPKISLRFAGKQVSLIVVKLEVKIYSVMIFITTGMFYLYLHNNQNFNHCHSEIGRSSFSAFQ